MRKHIIHSKWLKLSFVQWKDRADEPFGFKWPKEPVNALGVFFSYNQASANRVNFGEK